MRQRWWSIIANTMCSKVNTRKSKQWSPTNRSYPSSPLFNKDDILYQAVSSVGGGDESAKSLILGLLEDSQVGDVLKEAGVRGTRVKTEVEKLRGKEGTKGSSASGDYNFQALKNYGRDLVEQAVELNPVIGRDEEIRRVVRILSMRTKNNPVLIGEPGVGKIAVVGGLA
ncbi:hypothetical protein IFM89_000571 [Coptis chinensis]|uniref:Uncharacterized protein n=1 Tax=Coptis chinensis TaxID=261450 RepID=A0A835IKD7_9MAGN|nr:hypothetical protein IFM89_000571 [Coptis chinensis]